MMHRKPPAATKKAKLEIRKESSAVLAVHPTQSPARAKARHRQKSKQKVPPPSNRISFPIVAIGASAGGLEAFTELLQNLPSDTGMAFVLVQHLDPTHESILVDLLAKTTVLPVTEAHHLERVKPNHVYVIPPNTLMTLSEGALKLAHGKREPGPHRCIDIFLESLAHEQGNQAIGVILSGSASDGTLGLEEVKNEGGIAFAQDSSAQYESMPRNAIAAGCVDFVLSPAKIAQELGKIALHAQVVPQSLLGPAEPAQIADHYEKVLHLLKTRTGVDFSLYKPITLERRIARRMVLNKIPKLPAYLTFLRSHPSELEALYQDVLIHVTSFFRDPETFEVLKQKVFPRMIKSRTPDDPVRAWVLGCSTGQEAYSIAMAYLEFASKASSQVPLQIFATDLNETLLEKSRAGLYSKAQVQDLSPERLRRFFLQEDGGFRICKPVRELCVFARHDVLADAPFSRLDLLSCRNLLIYITPASQNRLLPLFHYALKPKGFLLLGSSETVGNFSDLFAVEDKTHRIFSKKTQTNSSDLTFEFKKEGRKSSLAQQPSASAVRLTRELDAQKEADRLTIARYGPPGVLINEAMQILQFRGQTSPYLEPAAGKASFDLLKMAREGLMLPVRAAFQKAKSHNQAARLEDVAVRCEGQVRRVNVEIIPLNQLRERCFLVNFEPIADLPPEGKHQARKTESVRQSSSVPTEPLENRRLRNELSASREYLQSVSEQYEALNEELQATNEEAQSSNEELRSINEELETTKEELQSTNEELTTVNDEMNHRNLELHRTNSDLNNVLASVQMCIVVLGGDLSIRRFTSLAKRILNLVPTDIGRPITNIRPNFEFPELEKVILEVIQTAQGTQQEVQDHDGRWYSLRILPYQTVDKRIDGAVLVLVDIDPLKRSEQRIRDARNYAQSTLETVREPLLVLDPALRVESANRSFYNTFRVSPEETTGRLVYELGRGQWNIASLRSMLEEVLPERPFDDFEAELEFERIGRRTMLLNARAIMGDGGKPQKILLAIEDITERKQVEVLRESEQKFRTLAEALPDLVWTCTPDGQCDYFNSKWSDYTGVPQQELLGMKWRETVNPVDRERTSQYWLDALQGNVPYDLEYRIRRADGEYHWFKVRASPLRNKEGQIIKWFGTCSDIEEQKKAQDVLEEKVVERTAKLREALSELEAFSYSVSHDMRAPLRAMVGFADLILNDMGQQLSPTAQDYMGRIVTAANRLDRLIQDVLAYSRVSRTELHLGPVDLEAIIRDVCLQYAGLLPGEADLQIERPLHKVIGHEASLTQCVANLLSNAVKFVAPGTTPRIRIWTQAIEGDVRVRFEDNGIGIEPQNLGRIFSMFERLHSTREYEGTGIGLTIVRKAIERMDGMVGAESEPGKGSTFWFQLKGALA